MRDVARVVPGRRDRLRLHGIAAGERRLVTVLAEQPRERRTPGAPADDDDAHPASLCSYPRATKSIETGTPSSENRSRMRFSTQYA